MGRVWLPGEGIPALKCSAVIFSYNSCVEFSQPMWCPQADPFTFLVEAKSKNYFSWLPTLKNVSFFFLISGEKFSHGLLPFSFDSTLLVTFKCWIFPTGRGITTAIQTDFSLLLGSMLAGWEPELWMARKSTFRCCWFLCLFSGQHGSLNVRIEIYVSCCKTESSWLNAESVGATLCQSCWHWPPGSTLFIFLRMHSFLSCFPVLDSYVFTQRNIWYSESFIFGGN